MRKFEQPKLTEEAQRLATKLLAVPPPQWQYAEIQDLAKRVLTSPVAPPPRPLVPLDGGNWYYDAQRDIVMIDGRKYEPAVEEFRIPSVMAAIAPPVAPGEQRICTCGDSGNEHGCDVHGAFYR